MQRYYEYIKINNKFLKSKLDLIHKTIRTTTTKLISNNIQNNLKIIPNFYKSYTNHRKESIRTSKKK